MDEMDGFEYSVYEIDERLRELGTQLSRKMHREVVVCEIDELLDQRNELKLIMAEVAIEDYERVFNG